VVVGSRPGRARRSPTAETHLADRGLDPITAAEAGRLAATELPFGDNPRAGAAYRQAVCPVLVQRALLEVLHAG
jgi:CO/xanthine dehydrogenase FAD-binding subunit